MSGGCGGPVAVSDVEELLRSVPGVGVVGRSDVVDLLAAAELALRTDGGQVSVQELLGAWGLYRLGLIGPNASVSGGPGSGTSELDAALEDGDADLARAIVESLAEEGERTPAPEPPRPERVGGTPM